MDLLVGVVTNAPSVISEPIAMLLWGLMLLALCTVLRRSPFGKSTRNDSVAKLPVASASLESNLDAATTCPARG